MDHGAGGFEPKTSILIKDNCRIIAKNIQMPIHSDSDYETKETIKTFISENMKSRESQLL